MISLANYIYEVKTPSFKNDAEGIKSFCEYVFDPQFVKYVVNSDLTITLESITPSKNLYMDTKDLTEIPDFIVFSHIEKYCLGLGTDSKCKIKEWAPRVQGYCAGVIVSDRPKVQTIDLSECEIRGGLLNVENSGVQSIIGAHGENVQVMIKKNRNLDKLDIKGIKSCMNPGSWLNNNRNLEISPDELPAGIRVQNNKLKEKIYIS
jgi:hypothetical protein